MENQIVRLFVAGGEPVTADWNQVLIGTGPRCGLRLLDGAVAELHCAVVGRGGRYFLRNFAPSGTRVGGRLVSGELELRDGDGLQLGSQNVLVRFVPRPEVDLRLTARASAPPRTRTTQITSSSEWGAGGAPLPGPGPQRTRATEIRARSALTAEQVPTPTPRKTRVTQIIARPALTQQTEQASLPAAPAPRKTRVTQIIRKAAVAESPSQELSAKALPAPVPPTPEITEEAVASYLLAGGAADASPAVSEERRTAEPAPPVPGALPGYALATDAAGRPALRIVVGRKDRAEPLLRKWELEAARSPPRPLLWRRGGRWMPRGVAAAAVVALVALALFGGFHLGKPRQPRTFANPNPIVLTVDRWNELSDTDKLDYEILQQHLAGQRRPDVPTEAPNF